MVGATIVGRISVTALPGAGRAAGLHSVEPGFEVARGDEIGMFHLGSTAVVLFEPGLDVDARDGRRAHGTIAGFRIMSEASDDAQLSTQDEVVPPRRWTRRPTPTTSKSWLKRPRREAPRARATTRCRRRRASWRPRRSRSATRANPRSGAAAGARRALTSARSRRRARPSISFHDARRRLRAMRSRQRSRGSESLRAIGEAWPKTRAPSARARRATGGRPPVPRPRSQPAIERRWPTLRRAASPETRTVAELLSPRSPSEPPRARDKVPTVPDRAGRARHAPARPSRLDLRSAHHRRRHAARARRRRAQRRPSRSRHTARQRRRPMPCAGAAAHRRRRRAVAVAPPTSCRRRRSPCARRRRPPRRRRAAALRGPPPPARCGRTRAAS